MNRKVLAYAVGNKEAETEKAVCINHRWFPKAAISECLQSENGSAVVVFKQWFIVKNQWLVKDELGIGITAQTTLINGDIIFQGDEDKLSHKQHIMSAAEEDALFDELVSAGMTEMEASNEIRRIRSNR